jgi:hypothetical protein
VAQRASSSLYLPAYGQADVSLSFDVTAEGQRFEPTWGLDQAWISEQNLKKGINHMLRENIGIGRSAVRTFKALTNDSVLSADAINHLRQRANMFNQVSATLPITLTADQEGGTDEYFVKNKVANNAHWAANINSHVHWMQQNTQHPVVAISPFNEGDYWSVEEGATPAKQFQVAKLLKESYPRCADIAMVGGNTLNDDKALDWYNPGKVNYDWGNTHQLAGSFDNFARFYQQVRRDGKVGYADEMHNVGEAMIGLEYGMTVGIWWGFDSRARGEFCQISRHGQRLAYGEHRTNWTAASVWRHDDGRVKAFIGSSERQAATTTYQFVSTGRDVYYDGYGPVREFRMEIPGGAVGSYQKGQTNAERVIDVTWGEDVAPGVLNGVYKLVNKQSGNVASYVSSGSSIVQQPFSATNQRQQWTVRPCSSRTGGDYSFYDIESVANPKIRINVKNYATSTGDLIAWTQDAPTSNEQWYLEYAGNGYYYIRNRESALYMAAAGTAATARLIQTTMLAESARDRMLFRFLPVDVGYETAAPSKPAGLTAEAHAASVTLTWSAVDDTDVEGYMVVRAPKGSDEWNTIARKLTTTTFTDNTCRQGTTYIYKVKAIDRAQNLSEASGTAEATPTGERSMVARWLMDGDLNDATANMMDAAYGGTPAYVDGAGEGRQALRLTGSSSQYVQLPYEVAGSDELTVAMWVCLRSATARQHLFDFGYDTSHYIYLTPHSGSGMRLALKNGDDEQTVSCGTRLPLQQWKHVAVTIGSDKTAIYVDGQEVASGTDVTIRPSDVRPVLNYLGRSQSNSDPFLSADLSDVRIYNYAVSADDVKAIMDGETPTGVEPAAGPAAQPAPVYGLDGVRRDAPRRGVNIIDGKKVMR